MKINRKLRSGKADIDAYITELEDELTRKETSAITGFIINANKIAKILSSDLGAIAEGGDGLLINEDKEDKRLERVLSLLKNVDTFDQISKIADSLTPEEIDASKEESIQIDPTENAYEQIAEKVRQKNRGK